jgi:hypothetical protein
MTDADRYRLLNGPYTAPRWRYGRVVMDEVRGEVTVVGPAVDAGRVSAPRVGGGRRPGPPIRSDGMAVRVRRTRKGIPAFRGRRLGAGVISGRPGRSGHHAAPADP